MKSTRAGKPDSFPKFTDAGAFSKWVHDQAKAGAFAAVDREACEAAHGLLRISPEYHLARVTLTLNWNPENAAKFHAEWFRQVGRYVSKKDEGDSLDAFLGAMDSVCVPYMGSVFEAATATAKTDKRPLPQNIPPRYGLLFRLCCALSEEGEHEFFVDLDSAGKFLGVDRMTTWRWVNALCAVGAISLTKKAEKNRARRFELAIPPTPSVSPHPQ